MFNWIKAGLIKVFNRNADKSLEPANDFADWAEAKAGSEPAFPLVYGIDWGVELEASRKPKKKKKSGSKKKATPKKKTKKRKTKRG